jgi:hypothetical protein
VMESDNSGGTRRRRPQPALAGTPPTLENRRAESDRGGSGTTLRRRTAVTAVAVLVVAVLVAVFLPSDSQAQVQPEQVLRQYVHAMLTERNDAAAAALACRSPQLDAVRQWQQDLAARQVRFHTAPLRGDVAGYSASATGRQVKASVAIAVALVVGGRLQERMTRPYAFTLVREDGWKVCAATPQG